jgi:hypothetical protein
MFSMGSRWAFKEIYTEVPKNGNKDDKEMNFLEIVNEFVDSSEQTKWQ